ncbi:hypothetical protein EIL81_03665 [Photorhabdus laumondii subsp. laumondii]|nr:hypothetical protein [Photorhabdus laumondii subsp. laumondii]
MEKRIKIISLYFLFKNLFTPILKNNTRNFQARERIPGSIANYVTGVSECGQQRGNLKDDGYSSTAIMLIHIPLLA